jgi:RNA polymerase sigma factor (sigma-70 family)
VCVETLVRRHWDAAHRTAFLIVQDTAAAEDIAQEAMLAAVRAIDGFDRRRPFRPWLHRIVVNRSLDWVKARQRRPEVSGDLFNGVAEPDLSVSGTTGTRVHRVRVVYTDTSGTEHDLDVDFERVPPELRERVGRNTPAGTFVAFVPGEWAARDDVAARLDLRAVMGTGRLELSDFAKRERKQAREAMLKCAVHQPDPWSMPENPDPEAVERMMRPHEECMDEHMPPSPVTIIVYDEQGEELERWEEPLVLPPSATLQTLPREPRPWDKRPSNSEGSSEVFVLAEGRAPEGTRYEWFVDETVDEDGDRIGVCTTLRWPRYEQVGAHGSCGPQVPPVSAYGRRRPDEVMAKPFGFLDAEVPATEHYMLSGYARPRVERVRVVWAGGSEEAPVELFEVTPEKADRMGAAEPFGFWVTFVPRSARHAEFEIVSYGEGGDEIGRYRYRSEVTN